LSLIEIFRRHVDSDVENGGARSLLEDSNSYAQIGIVTNELTGVDGQPPRFPWDAILIYVFLRFLQSGVGLIQATQNYLWIPIGQYTTREISVKMFEHLHGLSLSYHINRKTGEVLRVMDRGTNSIITLLNQIIFQIFPVLLYFCDCYDY